MTGCGLKTPPFGCERREARPVDLDPEVRAQCAHELGIDRERAVQLELEVGVMPTDRERTQQYRRRARQPADAPGGEPDAEAHRIETARRAQLDVLGREALRGDARGAEGDFVAEEVRQERRASRDELRKTAGVRLRDLDAGLGEIGVVQERRRAAEHRDLSAQTFALGFCDVHDRHSWFGKAEVTGGHGCRGHVVLRAPQGASFCSPHTSQRMRALRLGEVCRSEFRRIARHAG